MAYVSEVGKGEINEKNSKLSIIYFSLYFRVRGNIYRAHKFEPNL